LKIESSISEVKKKQAIGNYNLVLKFIANCLLSLFFIADWFYCQPPTDLFIS